MMNPQPPTRFDGHPSPARDSHGGQDSHGGHSWMMIACCIPMLVIAVALVATGVVGPGFLVVAVLCTAIMAMMMRGMHDGERDDSAHTHGNGR